MSDEQADRAYLSDYDPLDRDDTEDFRKELEKRYRRLRVAPPLNEREATVLTAEELAKELGCNMVSLRRMLHLYPILIEHKWTRRMGTYDVMQHVWFGFWCEHAMFDLERDALFRRSEIDKLQTLFNNTRADIIETSQERLHPAEKVMVPLTFDIQDEIRAYMEDHPVCGSDKNDLKKWCQELVLHLRKDSRGIPIAKIYAGLEDSQLLTWCPPRTYFYNWAGEVKSKLTPDSQWKLGRPRGQRNRKGKTTSKKSDENGLAIK
jgi:hypothetical protein